ncbi:arylesterase [Methylobrevis albus]|uniref:Arylesterase n=1 Tax=Methylobrevis albus TaxID=2793297 RepID=A0A931I1S9_9HYPH|nr:arylesterase [Methylobrevis albus]MBH0237824.1 arylesterase [Methylobrevis albus]
MVMLAGACAATVRADAAPVRIVAFGDSLTAGYGLSGAEAFPARLEAALQAKGHDVTVVNAGVSGDTSSAGLARLDWSIGADADAVIVELGANDALRGVDPDVPRRAIDQILGRLKERGLEVLLAGMYAPPNLGDDYVRRFNGLYPELAEKHGALLYPFFLDGVVGNARLNLPDGIHPTAAGVDIIVERILPSVEQLVARVAAKR